MKTRRGYTFLFEIIEIYFLAAYDTTSNLWSTCWYTSGLPGNLLFSHYADDDLLFTHYADDNLLFSHETLLHFKIAVKRYDTLLPYTDYCTI